jgi:hypothetical protein
VKKETLIIIFYSLYFIWLLSITFLTANSQVLNYFSIVVVLFYFLLLREKGDLWWFWLGALIPIAVSVIFSPAVKPTLDLKFLTYTPAWLPLAWGTTFVALRKFFVLLLYK